jgi:hypothetical protein
MSAGRTIATIAAVILIFFGVMFVYAAFASTGTPLWIFVGLISIGVGFGIIWFSSRQAKRESAELIQKIELSGDIELETMNCKHCGGALSTDNIKMVAGAPVVSCPYCNSTYQLSEEPKW